MTDIFTLGVKADTKDIDRGAKSLDNFADKADRAEKQTGELRKGVNVAGKAVAAFGIAATTALGGIAVSAGEAAREIKILAQVSNLTTEEFQRNAFAARAVGIDMKGLSDVFKDFQDRVGDFVTTGAGPMIDFFEQIAPKVGVTAEQFRGLSGKDALQLYVSSLEKANLSQAEMVFFMETMASEATQLIPLLVNNSAEFEKLSDRASELGLVLDDIDITNLNEMKGSLGELTAIASAASNVLGATLAPFITDLSDRMIEGAGTADDYRDSILDLVEVGVAVAGIYADAGRVFEIFGTTVAAAVFQATEVFDTFDTRLDLAISSYRRFSLQIGLSTREWINELLEKTASGMSELLDLLDPLDLIDSIEFSAPQLDTTAYTAAISVLTTEAEGLEQDLTQSNENIADAWQDVLDLLAKPLPSQQFDQWFENIKKTILAQRELQKEVKKTGTTAITTVGKTTKAERDFRSKRTSEQLADLKNITSITKNAFSERSKAREALHKAEQAFSAIEIALSFQKSAANALEAISSAFAAPFPVNFAAGAAMISIMSGLGLFGGGSSGGGLPTADDTQASQGTGTLLGSDEKSQSIINAQGRFEDISIDQLAELRGIRNSINSLASGIDKLATSIVGGVGIGEFGGETGITAQSLGGLFSKTTKTVVDEGIKFVSQSLGDIIDQGIVQAQSFFTVKTKKKKLFGLTSSTRVAIETQDLDETIREEMGFIFQHIGDTVLQSAQLLGFETVDIVRSTFVGPLFGNEDFRGAFQGRFSEFFGSAFETVSVSIEDALAEFTVDIGMISFEGLSGEEIQQELQAIFSQQADLIAEFLVPSIAEYQKVGEGLFDTLLRVTQEQVVFNDSIAQMGISLADLSNVMQIDIAQSIIDLIGGAERFRDLTGEFFSEFFTEAEQFERLATSLTEAVEGLGLSMFDSRDAFRAMVEGLDLTTDAGQALFASLLELVPSMGDYFDTLERDSAMLAAEAERELEEARRAETAATREAAAATRELERAASSALSSINKAVKEEQSLLKTQLKEELAGIRNTFEDSRQAVQNRVDQQIDSMERQLDVVNGQVSALTSLSDMLGTSITQVVGLGRAQARALVRGAIDAARSGQSLAGLDIQGAVSSLTSIEAGEFTSRLALQTERARTANDLAELKKLTDGQLSEAQQTVLLMESQIETIKRSGERQIEALNILREEAENAAQDRFESEFERLQEIADTAREQLDALLGIDTGIKTLAEAQALFAEAINDLTANQASAQEAAIRAINDNIEALTANVATPGSATPDGPLVTTPTTFSSSEVLQAIAVSSAKTAKLLDRWDGDGQPEVRDVS